MLWNAQAASLSGCALLAVGGYGRCEMYPHSDVDLLILHPEGFIDGINGQATQSQALAHFVTQLWDLGVQIGHSVRSVADCLAEAAGDITVQTALLESRWLAGDLILAVHMQRQFLAALSLPDFLQAKVLEMDQRHQRFENTPYALEPNVKESPGGLRDLHVLLWLAKAAGLVQAQQSPWLALQNQGLFSTTELASVRKSESLLQTLRLALHTLAARREDRLVFDLQSSLATHLGYRAKTGRRASELLMQRYYIAAKTISQLNRLLLQALERRILGEASYQQAPVIAGYAEQNGFLHALDLQCFERDPVEILNVFHILAEHPHLRDLSAETQRAVWNARNRLATVRQTPAFKAAFMRFFTRGAGLTRSFRRMNELGILGRSLPAFRRIVGQMQHDLFHVYTVDQHILTVLRNMRRFAMPQHVHEYPLCSQLIASFDAKHMLYISAVFHDIAKGRGGDHSDLGQDVIRRFGRDMGLSLDDIALGEFLVKHHLTMSTIAQKSDLSNPEVIAKFAQIVGNETQLAALYMLTVADIRGTSPKVWNAWKGKLLEGLYHATARHFRQSSLKPKEQAKAHKPAQQAQDAVRDLLPQGTDASRLWRTLEDSYFLRNEPADAAWHTQVLLPKLPCDLVVASRSAPDGTGIQVLVFASDQPELFARICSCFDALGLSVLDAQVYTTQSGQALDHFVLANPEYTGDSSIDTDDSESPSALLLRIEAALTHSLSTLPALPAPRSARLPRQARHFAFAPRCHITPDEKGSLYLLEIQAVDQPSVLYRISTVFAAHQVSVHTARITTLGGRVEDFFILSGACFQSPKQQLALEAALLKAVEI